jgi:hypothetical protein
MKTGAELVREMREAEAERKKGRKVLLRPRPTEKLLVCADCNRPGGTMVDSKAGRVHDDCQVAAGVRKRASNKLRRLVQKLRWKRKRKRGEK